MPPNTSHSPRGKKTKRNSSVSANGKGRKWKTNTSPFGRGRTDNWGDSSPSNQGYSPGGQSDTDANDESHMNGNRSGRPTTNGTDVYPSLPQSDRPPLTYASLPPTPISSSPPRQLSPTPLVTSTSQLRTEPIHDAPFSLWDYLWEELLATDFDSHQELKWERVSNFLSMPYALEKIFFFGFVLCFDSFLYNFTIQPIRFVLACFRLISNTLTFSSSSLPASQKADILRMLLVIISVVILGPLTDASKIYHSIRGQDTIKLYVIFNALEIADRLCASIGQDIMDCLFSRSTLEVLSHRKAPSSHTLRSILYFSLALIYNLSHTFVMIYQMIALNVAINSYDHALLTLLVSNQFVEIKGSVFKKFEKDNLFQITCADIVERFTLALMLFIIAFRNLIELSGDAFTLSEGFALPKSFGWFRGNNVIWTISYPVVTVMVSEMLVDWLKHAFIAKFNHIRPSVYERYTDVLCRDLSTMSTTGRKGARKHVYVDQSPLVARRLGFASLPLAVLVILIGSQTVNILVSMHMSEDALPWTMDINTWKDRLTEMTIDDLVNVGKWVALAVLFWICTVVIKLIMGVRLLSYATRRRAGMENRVVADVVNDFGRDPIGEGKDERQYNRELKTLLDNKRDDAAPVAEIGENKGQSGGGGEEKKKRPTLEEITRFTMVKRIW